MAPSSKYWSNISVLYQMVIHNCNQFSYWLHHVQATKDFIVVHHVPCMVLTSVGLVLSFFLKPFAYLWRQSNIFLIPIGYGYLRIILYGYLRVILFLISFGSIYNTRTFLPRQNRLSINMEKMVLTQRITWVYKVSVVLTYPPNIIGKWLLKLCIHLYTINTCFDLVCVCYSSQYRTHVSGQETLLLWQIPQESASLAQLSCEQKQSVKFLHTNLQIAPITVGF